MSILSPHPDVRPHVVRTDDAPPWCAIAIASAIALLALFARSMCAADAAAAFGYGPTVAGAIDRLLFSLFPHTDPIHLILNVLYLVCVGYFVEPMIGAVRTGCALALCHLAGGITLAFAADPHILETGASNAIHGLLACGYVVAMRASREPVIRIVCAAGLAYFAFMVIYAIHTGHMPWPVAFFVNCGWGHLGGIAAGAVLGCVLVPIRKPDAPSPRRVSQAMDPSG
jgi:membrane associated rhomboid family serine protease